jgi:arginase family enzyme
MLIVEIDSLIAQSSTALAKAPKVKGSRVDLKVLQADIDAVKGALATATQTYQNGGFASAKAQLEAVKAQISGTKGQIEAAKASGPKK